MKVILDACVLYPTVMRDILLACADAGMYRPHWSARILEEWARAAARLGPEQEAVARGEIAILQRDWAQAFVPVATEDGAALYLPDANDVHVLASGIEAGCEVIVTMNLRDFPNLSLAEFGLSAVHPDAFLLGFLAGSPSQTYEIVEAVRCQVARLSGQDWAIRALLKKARLPRLGKALERLVD